MARLYSRTEVLAEVDDLNPDRLDLFVQTRLVSPLTGGSGPVFDGPVFDEPGVARLQLLCDLAECYDLDVDGLALVMSLIDQLNTARGDMRALVQAVADQPDEVRGRISRTVQRVQIVTIGRG